MEKMNKVAFQVTPYGDMIYERCYGYQYPTKPYFAHKDKEYRYTIAKINRFHITDMVKEAVLSNYHFSKNGKCYALITDCRFSTDGSQAFSLGKIPKDIPLEAIEYTETLRVHVYSFRNLRHLFESCKELPTKGEIARYLKTYPNYESLVTHLKEIEITDPPFRPLVTFTSFDGSHVVMEDYSRIFTNEDTVTVYSCNPVREFIMNHALALRNPLYTPNDLDAQYHFRETLTSLLHEREF